MQKFIKRILIAYDTDLCQAIYEGEKIPDSLLKRESVTVFHSKAEFKLFLWLQEICFKKSLRLERQIKFTYKGFSWIMDFSISNTNKILQKNFDVIPYNGKIYVEYKGIYDRNYIKKMQYVTENLPIFNKSLIIVSDNNGAFGHYCKHTKKFICKPVYSLSLFKELFIKTE